MGIWSVGGVFVLENSGNSRGAKSLKKDKIRWKAKHIHISNAERKILSNFVQHQQNCRSLYSDSGHKHPMYKCI